MDGAQSALQKKRMRFFATKWRKARLHAYCISVMGEAVKRLSPDFQRSHPEVNWSDIAKMRDLLVHAYHRVDWTVVWDTVTTSIPETLRLIEKLVPPEEK